MFDLYKTLQFSLTKCCALKTLQSEVTRCSLRKTLQFSVTGYYASKNFTFLMERQTSQNFTKECKHAKCRRPIWANFPPAVHVLLTLSLMWHTAWNYLGVTTGSIERMFENLLKVSSPGHGTSSPKFPADNRPCDMSTLADRSRQKMKAAHVHAWLSVPTYARKYMWRF